MANNNRTEAQSAVTTTLVPTITLAQHAALLNNEINTSVVFDKDVIAAETPIGGSVTVDFSNKDTATITTAVSLAVSFTGLQNGAVKYVVITKQAANVISFVGATDISARKDIINTTITYVIYKVSNKNGSISVDSINVDNDISSELGSTLRKKILIGDWDLSATPSISVAHGLSFDKIIGVSVMIRNDSSTKYNFIAGDSVTPSNASGAVLVNSANVVLYRSSIFANSSFNQSSYNRGWIIIEYER
jgi:hypothetical protein